MLSARIYQWTDRTGYGPFRPNKSGYHSDHRYYRGGWHRYCPVLADAYDLSTRTARIRCGHSVFPYHSFLHCKVFAPAAPRRAWIHVSESISGLLLSQPVPVVGWKVRYTLYYLIGRRPILRRNTFTLNAFPAKKSYPELSSVSRDYAGPKGRLSTCY